MEEQKPKAPRKPRTSKQEKSSPKPEIASSETTFPIKPEDAPKVPEEVKPEVTPSVEPDEPVVPDEPEKPTFPIKLEDYPKVPEKVKPEEAISPEEIKPKSLEETKVISPEEEEAAMEREFLEKGKLKVSLYKLNPNLEDGKSKWAFALVVGDLKHIHFKGSFVRAHKWAENYCLSHGLDPKTIQLIKK